MRRGYHAFKLIQMLQPAPISAVMSVRIKNGRGICILAAVSHCNPLQHELHRPELNACSGKNSSGAPRYSNLVTNRGNETICGNQLRISCFIASTTRSKGAQVLRIPDLHVDPDMLAVATS